MITAWMLCTRRFSITQDPAVVRTPRGRSCALTSSPEFSVTRLPYFARPYYCVRLTIPGDEGLKARRFGLATFSALADAELVKAEIEKFLQPS